MELSRYSLEPLRKDETSVLSEAPGNIVLNASPTTPPGGAGLAATFEHPDGSQLWVVHDTGRGRSKEDVLRLGTPFFSRRAGGSGVGLAAAREVIDRHGGLTHVESRIRNRRLHFAPEVTEGGAGRTQRWPLGRRWGRATDHLGDSSRLSG
jgi:signal transduction histidine kinase